MADLIEFGWWTALVLTFTGFALIISMPYRATWRRKRKERRRLDALIGGKK